MHIYKYNGYNTNGKVIELPFLIEHILMCSIIMTFYYLFVIILSKESYMFKERSKLLFLSVIFNCLFSIWVLFYFSYIDRLNYSESLFNDAAGIALVIQNMFTSTWWALIILTFALITIFSLVCFVYKDLKFQFMSICL